MFPVISTTTNIDYFFRNLYIVLNANGLICVSVLLAKPNDVFVAGWENRKQLRRLLKAKLFIYHNSQRLIKLGPSRSGGATGETCGQPTLILERQALKLKSESREVFVTRWQTLSLCTNNRLFMSWKPSACARRTVRSSVVSAGLPLKPD